jgi:phage terminase small subunit
MGGVTGVPFAAPQPELERLGLLTALDQAEFASYCVAVSRWKRAEKALVTALTRVTPSGRRVAKAQIAIVNAERAWVHKLAEAFGLNPIARSHLNGNPEAVTPGGRAGTDLTLGGLLDYNNPEYWHPPEVGS